MGEYNLSNKIKSEIIKYVYLFPDTERKILMEWTGLPRATVNKFVLQLLKEKKLAVSGYAKSTGGKPSELLAINPKIYRIAGIIIKGNLIHGVITDLSGSILNEKKIKFKTKEMLKVNNLISFLDGLINSMDNDGKIKCIGIGIHGLISYKNNICTLFSGKSIYNINLTELIEIKIKINTYIDDIVRVCAITEKKYGKMKDTDSFIYVFTGEGIGLGIIYNNRLFYGTTGISGELGHTIINIADAGISRCVCGNYGCIESFASNTAIVKQVMDIAEKSGNKLKKNITIKDIINSAKEGDKISKKVLESAIYYLGKGIANAVNLFGINKIIIGGDLVCAGEKLFLEPLTEIVKNNVLNLLSNDTEIFLSSLNEKEITIGAGLLAFNKYIEENNFNI